MDSGWRSGKLEFVRKVAYTEPLILVYKRQPFLHGSADQCNGTRLIFKEFYILFNHYNN